MLRPSWLLLLALAGCGAQASVNVQHLQQLTEADLIQAVAIANAASPPDVEGATCFTFIHDNLALLFPAIPRSVGPISAFELGHVAVNAVGGMNPVGNQPLEIACGPYALNVAGGIAGLLARFGVQVGSGGVLPFAFSARVSTSP